MSWTPTFLISKEEFDKDYPKISGIIDKYNSNRRAFYSDKENMVNEEYKRLSKNATELGVSYEERKLKQKAEKIVEESSKFKKLYDNFNDEGSSISNILEYHSEDEFYVVKGNKYYLFRAEFSSQAYDLKEFLDKNKIPYSTGEN